MSENIEISIQTPLSLNLESDESILNLILESILDNCVRYKSANRENRIRLSAHQTLFGVEFVIEDNGDGIPTNVLPQVFEMFFRGHVRATGHGLGLYLVKKALEKLGGTIEVESQVDEFTRVKFYIPNAS